MSALLPLVLSSISRYPQTDLLPFLHVCTDFHIASITICATVCMSKYCFLVGVSGPCFRLLLFDFLLPSFVFGFLPGTGFKEA